MRSTKKTAAIVLAGAVGLSAVAYGVGTQVDGGSSVAAAGNNASAQRGPAPPGLGDLSTELGVNADQLEDALRDFHEAEHADMRSAFAAALAGALGKPAQEVQSALDKLERKPRPDRRDGRPGHHHGMPLRQLAAELGVSRAELRTALRELRPGHSFEQRRDELVTFLADRFGLSEEKVEAALPEFAGRGPGGPGAP